MIAPPSVPPPEALYDNFIRLCVVFKKETFAPAGCKPRVSPRIRVLKYPNFVSDGALDTPAAPPPLFSQGSAQLRDGPTTTTTIFESISRGPTFHFWGTPGWRTKCPFYIVEHRETTMIFHLMCHQMPFWWGIRCKTFLEDYGCGCVWAVPDLCSVAFAFQIRQALRIDD